MDADIRQLRPGEGEAFIRSVVVPFLDPVTGDPEQLARIQREAATIETDRAWVAETDGRFVANACIISLDLTLPAPLGRPCPVVPMAGVSAVGVHPTHRRQGLLRRLMTTMLEDARQRGECMAGLNASESIIYGRFGFGLVTDMAEYRIATRESAFGVPAPRLDLRLIDKDEAAKVLPELFERQRRIRAGEPGRNSRMWGQYLTDADGQRNGASGMFFAVCEEGYVCYRRGADASVLQGERVEIVVEELRGMNADVEAALWRFVLDLDLVGRVTARRRPVDEPVRWRLLDPRQLRTLSVHDRLYLRILDVPAALEARGYRTDGRLALDVLPAPVHEGPDPAVGKWVIEAAPAGATCRPAAAGEDPDLRLDVTALGSLYLGGFPASLLAAAGRVGELTAGSLQVADALFATSPAPLSATGF